MRSYLLLQFLLSALFACVSQAYQGASYVSKADFITLRQAPDSKPIKLQKSDFLLTFIVGSTDSSNPNWIQVSQISHDKTKALQGTLHKRDIISLAEKDYQAYIQTLITQIITSLPSAFQSALQADDPTLQALSQKTLETLFISPLQADSTNPTTQADEAQNTESHIANAFYYKRLLLSQLAKKSYQEALESAVVLGFSHTMKVLLEQKGIDLEKKQESTQVSTGNTSANNRVANTYGEMLLMRAITAKTTPNLHSANAANTATTAANAARAKLEIIQSLIAQGVNVNAAYGEKSTPSYAITQACEASLTDIAKALLDSGANPTPPNHKSALICAITTYNTELTKILLDSGAKLASTTDPSSQHSTDYAYFYETLIHNANHKTAPQINPQVDTQAIAESKESTPLESSVAQNNTNTHTPPHTRPKLKEIITLMLDANLSLANALQVASASGDGDMVSFLLQKGLDSNGDRLCKATQSAWDCAPIISALQFLDAPQQDSVPQELESHIAVIRALLCAKADINITNAQQQTIAQWLSEKNAPQAIMSLFSSKPHCQNP